MTDDKEVKGIKEKKDDKRSPLHETLCMAIAKTENSAIKHAMLDALAESHLADKDKAMVYTAVAEVIQDLYSGVVPFDERDTRSAAIDVIVKHATDPTKYLQKIYDGLKGDFGVSHKGYFREDVERFEIELDFYKDTLKSKHPEH